MITATLFGLWGVSGITLFSYLFWMDIAPQMHGKPSKIKKWTKVSASIAISFVILLVATLVSAFVEGARQ